MTPKYYTLHGWNDFGALTCLHGHDPEEMAGNLQEVEENTKSFGTASKPVGAGSPGTPSLWSGKHQGD